ncbi:hypothetical protein BAY59_14710 [Prauserella coralliicola]|nr:hypothetical protein BAY59_14710 [Prauserella coralliicola]
MAVELRLMRYVIAISEAGSFEAAAARLHMTQPPLSRQIRELERELGVELFHRRPTRLTSAGEVFVASAKEILAATDQLVRDVRAEGDAHYDTVRVGYTLTTAFSEMPALVAFLRDHHAGIVVDAHEAWDTELTAALDEGRLDVVIGRFVSVPRSCRTRGLRRDRFAIVVGAGHPLAGEDSVSLTDRRCDSSPVVSRLVTTTRRSRPCTAPARRSTSGRTPCPDSETSTSTSATAASCSSRGRSVITYRKGSSASRSSRRHRLTSTSSGDSRPARQRVPSSGPPSSSPAPKAGFPRTERPGSPASAPPLAGRACRATGVHPRGAYMITATPARQMRAPMTSNRSGR